MVAQQSLETRAAVVWIEDGIVVVRSKGVRSTTSTIDDTFAAIAEMTADGPKVVLFDARLWPGGEPTAWTKVITSMPRHFMAGAMLVDPDSPPELGRYPDLIDRFVVPFRVFTDETEAREFLHSRKRPD